MTHPKLAARIGGLTTPQQPRLAKAPASLSTEQRIVLESSCVDLICQLEAMLIQVADHRQAGHLSDCVEIANKMLVALLDFTEAHLTGKPLDVVYERVAEAYELTQKYDETISSFSWSAVRRVIGRTSASEVDVLQAHADVGEAIAIVSVASLGESIGLFDDKNGTANQMHQSLKCFIDELRKVW